MTLEFEQLTGELEKMAETTAHHTRLRQERVAEALVTLRAHRTNWTAVGKALTVADQHKDPKFYRSAEPFDQLDPLDANLSPPPPPAQATLIATDGSQIMPDRHAAYLYYLINVGGIIYYHGSTQAPDAFSIPELRYPETDEDVDRFHTNSGDVNISRDIKEIETLAAKTAWDNSNGQAPAQPLLAILDQRLLYWPIGSAGIADNAAVTEWGEYMTKMRRHGATLCGYIDRPQTRALITLLRSLSGLEDDSFNWRTLGKPGTTLGLTDADLFREILQPGQRSKVFVNISPSNDTFAGQDPQNEVCFFYLNPGPAGQNIARVDIPRWVAAEEAAVTAVHSLLVDQCYLLGGYPYVLARADEMAVVGRRDTAELNFMMDVIMERHGLRAEGTAKQSGKEAARGARTRFEM